MGILSWEEYVKQFFDTFSFSFYYYYYYYRYFFIFQKEKTQTTSFFFKSQGLPKFLKLLTHGL